MKLSLLLLIRLVLFPFDASAGDHFQFDWLSWNTHVSDHIKALGSDLDEESSVEATKNRYDEDTYFYGPYTKVIDGISFGVFPTFDSRTDKLVALQVAYVRDPDLKLSKHQCSCDLLDAKSMEIVRALEAKYSKKKVIQWEGYNMESAIKSSVHIIFHSADTIVEYDYINKNTQIKDIKVMPGFDCRINIEYSKIAF